MRVSQSALKGLFWIMLATTLTGCGLNPSKWVKGIVPSVHNHNGDNYVTVAMEIDTGRFVLPEVDGALNHPSEPTRNFGSFEIQDSPLGDGSIVSLNVNATGIANLPKATGLLPNGDAIPVSENGQPVATVNLNVAGTGIQVHVLFEGGKALVGFSVSLAQLDGLGNVIGTKSFFPGYQFKNGIIGVGGIFSSNQAGESGVGIFADLSSVLQLPFIGQSNGSSLKLGSDSTSKSDKKEIKEYLEGLQKSKPVLTLP